jgi:acetoin:2,6-dichlorophenolindophenol oxidoreductase subunit beta
MIKSYGDVIKETLDEALSKDNSVFIAGEDIGVYGGCFGITKDLLDKYGDKRVIDMPMSESAITGLGTGSAIHGLRPIIEIMFMDFITLTYDQLFNHASIFSYLSNGKTSVPLVMRVPSGAGRGYGATHSKSLFAPLMNIPGIKIVAPSNAYEAKGLLNASIKDNNPVVFVEHKLLYGAKEDVTNAPDEIELGKAKVVKDGKDVLLISFSKTVHDCVEVANEMEKHNVSVEIIDLRTIKPLDMDTIKESIKKIGKVIVVEEGFSNCGIASEIMAKINETCFYSLNSAVRRVCTLDVPIPCFPGFENKVVPSKERIEKEILSILDE